ncbi:helix-turn-helix domain-containing protein [Effusibacillus consociatus]|uniref:Helix-turn-helix domain-containing protein n=1 Tax=Effusibacillus consociatus TaxID=1117041 RepID=A0ABV9PZK7_9BACL
MEHYTVVELATVLGVTDAALRQKIRANEIPFVKKDGKKSITTQDFENYLYENRCWNFEIPEWKVYENCKRPIKPQFTKIQGTLAVLKEYGITIEQRTLKRWIQTNQIKAYNLGGTYYIPIEILRKDLS